MPNNNPIKVTDTGLYPDFSISKAHKDKKLFISTETKLEKEGWKLDLTHTVRAAGKDFYPEADPDIELLELGNCDSLDGKKLALVSTAARIKDTGEDPAPKVTYKITFYVGDEELESFTVTSAKNPVSFYTKITFKLT